MLELIGLQSWEREFFENGIGWILEIMWKKGGCGVGLVFGIQLLVIVFWGFRFFWLSLEDRFQVEFGVLFYFIESIFFVWEFLRFIAFFVRGFFDLRQGLGFNLDCFFLFRFIFWLFRWIFDFWLCLLVRSLGDRVIGLVSCLVLIFVCLFGILVVCFVSRVFQILCLVLVRFAQFFFVDFFNYDFQLWL